MPPPRGKKPARVNTQELRARLFDRLGNQRAELYFRSLKRFLGGQLGKEDFDRICIAALGKENVKLHNSLIRSVYSNACTSATGPPPTPSKQAATGNSQTSTVSNGTLNCGAGVRTAARRVARHVRRFADKPSPLGKSPLGGEFASTGSRAPQEVVSVEDGEEVDQTARGGSSSPLCVQSRSPIRAPLGVVVAVQNSQPSTSSLDVCYSNGELPDSLSLSKALGDELKDRGGLTVPRVSADILNSGLNVYIGQMLRACLGVAKARGSRARMWPPNRGSAAAAQNSRGFPGCSYQASLVDLSTAVQSNARLLGLPPRHCEKIASHLLNR